MLKALRLAAMFAATSCCYGQTAWSERGPAYVEDTPGVSAQEKEWHYKFHARMVATQGAKEREARRAISALPEGVRQRAVLISAHRLMEMQVNVSQSDRIQTRWANGVDPAVGNATVAFHLTYSLYMLAADSLMDAAARCHSSEVARLDSFTKNKRLDPVRPCREAAYGDALIDATMAAGDRAVPQEVYATIDAWTRAVVGKALSGASVAGLFKVLPTPSTP